MKKKISVFALLFSLLFCSCTVQTDFDIFDLCERYNSLSGEKTLSTDRFVSDKGFYCFMTAGQTKILVTVKTDKNNAVNSLCVTAEKDEYSPEDRDEMLRIARLLFAAFNYGNTEKADECLSAVGFDEEYSPFSSAYKCKTDEKQTYTLYSNEYSFTVFAEKNKADQL